jgi:2-dehydro-3-deoxyphosphooctonate aldolase (KDO 8-P synthase)
VPHLARAAAAVGVDGVFVEVHENPDQAPSDGPNMLTLDALDALLRDVLAVRAAL